jgi:hypothetical protein
MLCKLVLMCFFVSPATAQDEPKSKPDAKRVSVLGLVTAEPLPPGYKATSKEIRDGETVRGHLVMVEKEGVSAKSVISIDERSITTRPQMVAATKGYINGTAQAFARAGLTLVKKSIPDLAQVDFKKPVVVDLIYQKQDGGEVFVQLQILFGKAGYNVQVVGESRKEFEAVTAWATSVREP